MKSAPDVDAMIEKAIGRAEPTNISVASNVKTTQQLFKDSLERLVYEQYQPAFTEVTSVLEQNTFRRPELQGLGPSRSTSRFDGIGIPKSGAI
jgi:hypothetical protein